MDISRRTFAATALASTSIAVAGCLGSDDVELEGESELPVPVAGDPDAEVTVMVFEDFSCPGCRSFKQNEYPQLYDAYVEPEEIRYEFRDFPISVDDQWSWQIAGAARSVQDQGDDDAFWEFTENIYERFDEYSLDAVEEVANDSGVDGGQVVEDVENERFRDEIDAETERAQDAGVEGTPTVVVDGEQVDPSFDEIESAIEDAL